MTPQMVLAEVEKRGIRLRATGESILYEAPRGALTPELREAIARHKVEIMEMLMQTNSANRTGKGACPGPELCGGCYEVPGGRFVHPPKISHDWIQKWEPTGAIQ